MEKGVSVVGKYKKKVQCPTCESKLGWTDLVETRTGDIYTYHCEACKWYWHVYWYKHYKADQKTWNWDFRTITDDFGKSYTKVQND